LHMMVRYTERDTFIYGMLRNFPRGNAETRRTRPIAVHASPLSDPRRIGGYDTSDEGERHAGSLFETLAKTDPGATYCLEVDPRL
jgi:hypothetical protein